MNQPSSTTTMDPELEHAIRDALPDGCEVAKACGHLCGAPAAWTATFRCACPDVDVALVCTLHVRWVTVTDFACVTCSQPMRLIRVARL